MPLESRAERARLTRYRLILNATLMSMASTVAKITTLSIYNILKAEHDEVNLLLNTLEASPNIEGARKVLFNRLCNELRSHTIAEQEAVYNKVKEFNTASGMITEAEKEHQTVEKLLTELESTDMTSDAWLLKLAELKKNIEHHVREEESEIFDTMHEFFSDEEARDLGKEFQEVKNTELKRLKEV